MTNGLNPYEDARRDAHKFLTRAWYRVVDFGKTHLTLALGKTLAGSAAAIAVAVYNLPAFAWIFCTAAILALVVYAIYSTRRLKRQDSELRHAWIANKRILQQNLDHQIASDTAILELLGERLAAQRRASHSAPSELRSALAVLNRRLSDAEARAEAAEAVKARTATDAQRRAVVRNRRGRDVAVPKGPAVEPIRRRREKREAERAELEAEILALASAADIAKAMEAEEVKGARRTRREREDAARKADQASRDRVRAGRRPTAEEPEHVITLGVKPNGNRDVRSGRGAPTPEQIARGEDRAVTPWPRSPGARSSWNARRGVRAGARRRRAPRSLRAPPHPAQVAGRAARYAATRARGSRSDGPLGSGSACRTAPSSGQQPQGAVRSNGSRPWRHSWSARRQIRPASIGQRPPARRSAAR